MVVGTCRRKKARKPVLRSIRYFFYWWKTCPESSITVAQQKRAVGVCATLRRWFVTCSLLLVLAPDTLCLAADDHDGKGLVRFEISRQSADTALIKFAEQAGMTFMFPFEETSRITANPLSGKYSPAEALTRLLEGTGLQPRIVKGDVVTVRVKKSDKKQWRISMVSMERTRKRGLWSSLFGAAVAAGTGSAVHAQDEQRLLEEIVVTSQKREQSILDVPVSMSVFDAKALEVARIQSVEDWVMLSPNVSVANNGNAAFAILNIRGIENISGTVAANAVYLDEFALTAGTDSSLVKLGLLDVQRIEVLRGPQGTLFGRNAIGGTVLVNSNKPGPEFDASFSVDAGRFNTQEYRAMVNVPLVEDSLFARAAVLYDRTDGWIKNINPAFEIANIPGKRNDHENWTFRTALRWMTPTTTVDLSVMGANESQGLDDLLPAAPKVGEVVGDYFVSAEFNTFYCGPEGALTALGLCGPENTFDDQIDLFAPGTDRDDRTVNFNNPWRSGRDATIVIAKLRQQLGDYELIGQAGLIQT